MGASSKWHYRAPAPAPLLLHHHHPRASSRGVEGGSTFRPSHTPLHLPMALHAPSPSRGERDAPARRQVASRPCCHSPRPHKSDGPGPLTRTRLTPILPPLAHVSGSRRSPSILANSPTRPGGTRTRASYG